MNENSRGECVAIVRTRKWNAGSDGVDVSEAACAIEELLDAPLTPLVKPSPDSSLLLVEQLQSFPSIAEVAQPRYRLAGIRFNPATNGPSREVTMVKLWLQPVSGGAQQPIAGLPAMLKATHLAWSPDSKHVAFVQKEAAGLHLWIVDVAKLSAHRVGSVKLNADSATRASGSAIRRRCCAKWYPRRAEQRPSPVRSPQDRMYRRIWAR